jgi:hypothetical protein
VLVWDEGRRVLRTPPFSNSVVWEVGGDWTPADEVPFHLRSFRSSRRSTLSLWPKRTISTTTSLSSDPLFPYFLPTIAPTSPQQTASPTTVTPQPTPPLPPPAQTLPPSTPQLLPPKPPIRVKPPLPIPISLPLLPFPPIITINNNNNNNIHHNLLQELQPNDRCPTLLYL